MLIMWAAPQGGGDLEVEATHHLCPQEGLQPLHRAGGRIQSGRSPCGSCCEIAQISLRLGPEPIWDRCAWRLFQEIAVSIGTG